MRDLKEIRKDIDKIDNQLIELFKQRMDCARDVGIYKQANNIPVLNEGRENEILDAVEEKGGEYGASARLLYSNIMELSRALQHNIVGSGKELKSVINNASTDIPSSGIKVAYQGIKGANGHEATLRLFPNGEAVNYKSFADVFSAVDNGEVAFGVLPVENSSAGSVSAVYDLILKHRFYIVKALDLPIDYCLAGLKQSAFEDIEIVWSHPQSLSQCAQYIADHGFDSVPFSNTAIAARDVAKEKRLNVAAICSYKACEEKLYIPKDANRISLCFSLPHVTGSLYSLLCRFNSLGLNLTKIESRPRQGRQFEYLFYLDFSGNVRSENVIELVSQLSEEMPEFSFLGNYAEPEFPIK